MKQEVRRGRKFVEYHDPETQPEGTFTQEISAADVSYQDESGNWLPADENWQTDGLDGFVLKNDKLNHKVRLKGTGGRTWYPRRNVNTEYMTFGVPQYWNGKRWTNFSFSGWSVEGKTITLNTRENVTILVHNRWNGIKIDWILANSSAPSRMRYAVSLTGITYVDGIIYGADGERLGQLTPTTATDANGADLVCSGSYANGYVEFQADVSTAVYPVTIDPDFAGETASGFITGQHADYATARSTATAAAINALPLIGQRNGYFVYRYFLRFDTSSIPDTDTVTQVNLKLVCAYDYSTTNFDVQIVKQDWSGQVPITDATNRENAFDGCLAGTADSNIWRNTNGMSTNTQYASGDLDTTWVSKTGYTYYSLRSSLDYDGTQPTGNEYIALHGTSFATESDRPVLSVTYTAAATGVPKHFLHYARLRSN